MKNIYIKLTHAELYLGGIVGTMRRVASIQNGNDKHKHALISNWATDTDGACAEIAVAKHFGVYWEPRVNAFKLPDVGDGYIQVRSTTRHDGRLIVRANDADIDRFLLVICDVPRYLLIGSLLGCAAKLDEFVYRGTLGQADCWMVPQVRLGELPEKIA